MTFTLSGLIGLLWTGSNLLYGYGSTLLRPLGLAPGGVTVIGSAG